MREYNDYIQLTKNYLKDMNRYAECLHELEQQVEDCDADYASVPVKSPQFDSAGGGANELTTVESEAEKRLDNIVAKSQLQKDIRFLRRQMMRVNKAMTAAKGLLSEEELAILNAYYVDKSNYRQLARQFHYSSRTCRRKVDALTQKVAVYIFGDKASKSMTFIQN